MASQTEDDVLVEFIVEFLVAFTHQVLYYRNLYPPSIFERRRLYSIAVQRARHPELCSYIQNTINGLKEAIKANTLEKFGVSILSSTGPLLERFFVRLRLSAAKDGPLEEQKENKAEVLEIEFRGALQKLQHIRGVLPDLPDDTTWKVVAYIEEGESLTLQDWVVDHTTQELVQTATHVTAPPTGQIIPVKSIHINDLLTTHVYVEHYSD